MPAEMVAMPANTCSYDHYDIETLEPLNSDTYVRLQELGWVREEFSGKSVLDIGANSGLLTMHSLRLGAASVHACEVQPDLAEFIREVSERKALPVDVSIMPFHKLEPAQHEADVVLFMEVLHWAVSQGLTMADAILRLARLTRETLYLEFPWSVSEPSIVAQTSLTEESYSAHAALDELSKYFEDVHVVRFMHYFGWNSDSKRVLVRARGRRAEAELVAALEDTYSLNRPLSLGRNESYLLTSPRGTQVGKLLSPASGLSLLPPKIRRKTFDSFRDARVSTIVAPERIGDDYVSTLPDGRHFMLFPFVGSPVAGATRALRLSTESLSDLFVAVRSDFRSVGDRAVRNLKREGLVVEVKGLLASDAAWLDGAERYLPVSAVKEILSAHKSDDDILDALCHGDLQIGNIVADVDGGLRVVDLDTMRVGSVYSDGLLGLIWRAASTADLERFCEILAREESRPPKRGDVAIAIACGVAWFAAIRPFDDAEIVVGQIERFASGLESAIRLYETLPE